jgi:hypothetical protein
MFADFSGLLLGGPAVVGSLMDVVGRSTETVMGFNPSGPHPTPFVRTLLSVELLARMGFADEARRYRQAWLRLYPNPRRWGFPAFLLKGAPTVIAQVVDAVCFRPFVELGNKALAQVIRFERKEQVMIEEAAVRLAKGVDPGIIPARFLISATRIALEKRHAQAAAIQANFYKELVRR